MTALRVVRAAELQDLPADQPHWLIEPLWGASAVGVVGGAPKSGKTFLALELAVAVASGRPCLGRFAVPCPGPVLVLAAEDSPHQVKRRIQGIAHARGADFTTLEVRLILDTALRLDRPQDLHRLHLTLASQRPKLLILDPFVRLQRADENDARQVAAILAALRELAVTFNAAVLLVHHARKSGAALPGQALRGSGDFWAWGDSNLYLSGRPNRLRLTVEHRAAPPPAPLSLHLLATDHPRAGQPPLVRLELQDHPELSRDGQALPVQPEFRDPADPADPADPPAPPPPAAMTFAERIVAHLRSAGPTPHRALRATLRVRDQSLSAALRDLETAGRITRTPHGWIAVH